MTNNDRSGESAFSLPLRWYSFAECSAITTIAVREPVGWSDWKGAWSSANEDFLKAVEQHSILDRQLQKRSTQFSP